jgi:hypothetical protein
VLGLRAPLDADAVGVVDVTDDECEATANADSVLCTLLSCMLYCCASTEPTNPSIGTTAITFSSDQAIRLRQNTTCDSVRERQRERERERSTQCLMSQSIATTYDDTSEAAEWLDESTGIRHSGSEMVIDITDRVMVVQKPPTTNPTPNAVDDGAGADAVVDDVKGGKK